MSSNGRSEATALDHTAIASPQARQFAEIVEVRVTMKGFLGRAAELELLETGIRDFNLSLPEARGVVHSVADRLDVPLEREVERTLGQYMKAAAGRRKKLSRAHFDQATQIYQAQAQGEKDRLAVRARLKQLMEEHDLEPRRAGLFRTRRWYNRP
jgi:hypothetical protein